LQDGLEEELVVSRGILESFFFLKLLMKKKKMKKDEEKKPLEKEKKKKKEQKRTKRTRKANLLGIIFTLGMCTQRLDLSGSHFALKCSGLR